MRDETIEVTPEVFTDQELQEHDQLKIEKRTSQALTVRDAVTALEKPVEQKAKTSQELRVIEVSEALLPAYQKASTLELTDDEVNKLMEPFPDNAVEIRPHDGLIYIPHIHISDRLNRIFKPGKWSLMRRREWYDQDSTTMYGEYVLIIRGCYVGESVGGHPYVKKNAKINFSDVLESTAGEALRRIAGKRLSCGSQVWNPSYADEWCQKYRDYDSRSGKYRKRTTSVERKSSPPSTQAPPKQQAPPAPVASVQQRPDGEGEEFPTVTVLTVKEVHSKPDSPKKWTAYFVRFSDGFGELEAATFDKKIADLANELANTQENARLATRPGRKPGSKEIVKLERAEIPPEPTAPQTDNQPEDLIP